MIRNTLILSLLVIYCLVVASCKDDNTDGLPSQTVFKLTMDPSYSVSSAEEIWVVVKDDDTGELIDSKVLAPGKPAIIETTKKPDKLTVSIVNATSSSASADVYSGIAINSEWTLRGGTIPGQVATGEAIGNYSLTMTNIPSIYELTVSDQGGSTLGRISQFDGGIFQGTAAIHAHSPRQLVTVAATGDKPKYAMIENIKDNDDIVFNYSNLKDFDGFVDVTFPAGRAAVQVTGYDGTPTGQTSWDLYSNGEWGGPSVVQTNLSIGFLNSFNQYIVNFRVFPDDDHGFSYHSTGAAPTSISYVDPSDFTVTSPSLFDFTMTAKREYTYSSTIYISEGNGNYVVTYYTPSGGLAKRYDPATDEIADKYAFIDASKLKAGKTLVVVTGQSYQDLLDSSFKVDYVPAPSSAMVSINTR